MSKQFICVKCSGSMIKGYAADKGSNSAVFQTMWIDGEPVQANFLGITGDNVQISNTQRRTIRGLRCESCGYLELYAV